MKFTAILVLAIFLYAVAPAQSNETIHFYLTPSISAEKLKKDGAFIKEFLEKETGYIIELSIPASYDLLVSNFGATKQCFSIMNSLSYVVAREKYGAVVKLRTIRYGSSVYFGQIITKAGSGIKTISDLQGKTIAYTDVLSTSGYLYPKDLLRRRHIKPGKESFAKTHDEVVKLVYEGKVDAGATFHSPPSKDGTIRDARAGLKKTHPDIEKKVIIITTTDPIPNDPIVFSKDMDGQVASKLYVALVKLSTTEKGKEVLQDLYATEGFVRASDADYNSVRHVMESTK
jgi:phosphonate transport system substrate-binding protein